ncbi:MAG: hypothetical protein IJA34_08955 [Lachnospiraceae bacterium]|nr:hypothetical protein [Lachnospiraceae bacterium]
MEENNIIGYYDYYYDMHEYSCIGKGEGKLHIDREPNDVQRFFYNDKVCPFCKTMLKKVFWGFVQSQEVEIYMKED